MRPPVYLAPTEAQCVGRNCLPPRPCARQLSYHQGQQQGLPLGDYSLANAYIAAACCAPGWARWVDPVGAVKPVQGRQAVVHETPRGLA